MKTLKKTIWNCHFPHIRDEIYYEFKDTVAEYKSLKTYDDQLQEIINAQKSEIENILKQIDSLDSTNKDILPFLKNLLC